MNIKTIRYILLLSIIFPSSAYSFPITNSKDFTNSIFTASTHYRLNACPNPITADLLTKDKNQNFPQPIAHNSINDSTGDILYSMGFYLGFACIAIGGLCYYLSDYDYDEEATHRETGKDYTKTGNAFFITGGCSFALGLIAKMISEGSKFTRFINNKTLTENLNMSYEKNIYEGVYKFNLGVRL